MNTLIKIAMMIALALLLGLLIREFAADWRASECATQIVVDDITIDWESAFYHCKGTQ